MSGASALSSWALDKNPMAKTITLAYQLNCTHSPAVRILDTQETKDLVACLKKASVENLLQVQLHSTWFVPSFGPVIDQSTLNAKNIEILESSVFRRSFQDDKELVSESKHAWNVLNVSSELAGKMWKNFQPERTDTINHYGPPRGQIKPDAIERRRLESTALIFDNIPVVVGYPSTDPCSSNFPRSMYDLFHSYSNRSAILGQSNFEDRQYSFHQTSRKFLSKSKSNATTNDSLALTSKEVRFLRTFTQNLFTFHRQKIYDVLLYHYRDWESRSKHTGGSDQEVDEEGSDEDNLDSFSIEELLVDGLYLSPLMRMLKARISPSVAQQNPVWVYSFDDQPPDSGNWFSGSDYYEDRPSRIRRSKSCFNYESLVSDVLKADKRSDDGLPNEPRLMDEENARLLRAVVDLHLSYSFGLETGRESKRQPGSHRNSVRFWIDKLINFIHTGLVAICTFSARKPSACLTVTITGSEYRVFPGVWGGFPVVCNGFPGLGITSLK